MTGIVDWVDADQKIKNFLDRFGGALPSTLEVMIAQEDLWVYETLLKVIRNTNDVGQDPRHDPKHYQKPANHKVARIKKIEAMDIGKDAVDSWTRSQNALFTLPSDSGAAAAPSATAPTDLTPALSLLVGRYVDDKGKPLLDPRQGPFREFRMMPIDLKVVIEQKDIPRLLAECANSAMRIDVRSVRILAQDPGPTDLSNTDSPDAPTDSTSATSGSGTQPPTPDRPKPKKRSDKGRRGGGTGNAGMGNLGMGYMGMGIGQAASVPSEDSADPVYPPVPVEVQGIIYIYNPPPAPPVRTGAAGAHQAATTGGPPANAAAGAGPAAPAAPAGSASPIPGPAATVPAAAGAPTITPTTTPAPGVRP